MKIITQLSDDKKITDRKTATTIGVFDGLHLGHRAVIQTMIEHAHRKNFQSCIVTFDPTPVKFFRGDQSPPILMTVQQKIDLLKKMEIDLLVVLPFSSRIAEMTPDQFVSEIILSRLQSESIIVGYDWHFGRDRIGTPKYLKQLGKRFRFDVEIVGPQHFDGETIHSTRIRQTIQNGDLSRASQMLKRNYEIVGKVIRGDGRGKKIGFPTANLEIDQHVLPPNGVYAVRAKWQNDLFDSVLNCGVRPTFGGLKYQIEVHIFDFDRDIYGDEISITFFEKIRSERHFENVDSLIRQINADIAIAKKILRK